MSAADWIGLGIIALVIVGGLLLLNQITKPYDVKTEEEFQQRKQMGARTAGLKGVQPHSSGEVARPLGRALLRNDRLDGGLIRRLRNDAQVRHLNNWLRSID